MSAPIPWSDDPDKLRRQVLEVLNGTSPENRLWCAINHVLNKSIAQEDEGLYDENINNDVLNRRVGGKRALLWFKNNLSELFKEAHRIPASDAIP